VDQEGRLEAGAGQKETLRIGHQVQYSTLTMINTYSFRARQIHHEIHNNLEHESGAWLGLFYEKNQKSKTLQRLKILTP
jgi:hypothetical protein